MKKLKWWQAIGVTVVSAVLTGCGSSDDSSGQASLRVANATLTHASLNVLINGAAGISSVAADAISTAASPTSGSITLQVNDTASSTALATTVPTLTGGLHYTLLAYESAGIVRTVVLNEDYAALTAGTTVIHFYDAATDAGKIDVYVTGNTVTDISALSPTISYTTATGLSAGLTQAPGTYKIWVTGGGNKSDIRLIMPVVLGDTQNAIIAFTPASGGVLLNGSTLIQQSTYTAARNTNARVRLAAAVSGNVSVAASSGNVVIDGGSVAPALGFYTLVPVANALNISVAGNSVAAPVAKLTAGSDATLLVYGSPTTAAATLLTDDNRLPTDTTTAKVRLINGVTSGVGAITLTANTAAVGQSIAPGMASNYVSVPGSTTTTAGNLVFTSSMIAGNFFTATTLLFPNSVYTVMLGDQPGSMPAVQALVR